METVFVAVIKPSSVGSIKSIRTFKSKQFEILISDTSPTEILQPQNSCKNLVSDNLTRRTLPSLTVSQGLSRPKVRQAIINNLYQITSSSNISNGIKTKKVVHAKSKDIQIQGKSVNIALYVAPITERYNHFQHENSSWKFCVLSDLETELTRNPNMFVDEMPSVIDTLDRWLKRQLSKPHAVQTLFKLSPLNRIRENVTNPAYVADSNSDWFLLENKLTPEEAMKIMKEANKVDSVVYNPIFGSSFRTHIKVDGYVSNPYFLKKPPDYVKIHIPHREVWFKGQENSDENRELSWVEKYPLHRAASDGDTAAIQDILSSDTSGIDVWDSSGWAPIHYACWYGCFNAVKILLEDGGSNPNLCNKNETSLLHLAAGCGHHEIIKLLATHPLLDRHQTDKRGRTAIECCEQIKPKDWNKSIILLKDLLQSPYPKLVIHKMDGNEKHMEIRHGSNTTVGDILNSLNLSSDAKQYFALWITSKSLHLQLKPDHSPLVEMQNWINALCQLSGIPWSQIIKEQPRIVLKRNVKLLPNIEEAVCDIFAISLLYEEAHAQVLRGLYTCSDQVAIAMASIVLRINYGPFDMKKPKSSFFDDVVLRQLLPVCKLQNRTINWPHKLLIEYKEISQQGPGEISQLQLLYLRYCWTQMPAYGSAFFTGYAYATRHIGEEKIQRIVALYIGVNHRGIHFIKVESKTLLVSISYHSLSWQLREEENLFQVRTADNKINMIIHTPQAAFVCGLMTKLSTGVNNQG